MIYIAYESGFHCNLSPELCQVLGEVELGELAFILIRLLVIFITLTTIVRVGADRRGDLIMVYLRGGLLCEGRGGLAEKDEVFVVVHR